MRERRIKQCMGPSAASRKGQSILEYAVFLSVLCVVFLAMTGYMKNAVWSKFFVVQSRINEAVR